MGKPVVSKDKGTGAIQQSDIKWCQSDITGFEVGGEGNCLCDCAVRGSIKKTEFEQRNRVGGKRVCTERGGEWKLVTGKASLSGHSSMRAPRVGDSV